MRSRNASRQVVTQDTAAKSSRSPQPADSVPADGAWWEPVKVDGWWEPGDGFSYPTKRAALAATAKRRKASAK